MLLLASCTGGSLRMMIVTMPVMLVKMVGGRAEDDYV